MLPEVEVLVDTLHELEVVLVIVPELVEVELPPVLVEVELPPVDVEVELPLTSMSMLGVPLVVVVVVVVVVLPPVVPPEAEVGFTTPDVVPGVPLVLVVVLTEKLPPLDPPPKNPPKNPLEPPKPLEPPITIGVPLLLPQHIGAGAICGSGIAIGTIATSSGCAGISRSACRERGRGIARAARPWRRGAALADWTLSDL